ncbi:uncharacterized protein LOC6643634 [Drosophila willistoni]|uniref:uncharacterized protein LOC6643634 n=1 Tax=Drosophila willistoni TaxID=7260 RepID=UPI001F087283|nr:uncharacterized protein LOC6643634 [Drosophila willistoni]
MELFRFIKFIGSPCNAAQRNVNLRMFSSGPKKPSNNADLVIRGGGKCKSKEKPSAQQADKNKDTKKPSCEKLLMKKDDKPKKKINDKTAISGGGSKNVCSSKPKSENTEGHHANRWKKVSMCVALPLVALLTLLVFTTRMESERPEYIYYPHLYKRSKPFFFGDGNRTAYHNGHWNAVPPAGYEDEVDEGAAGQTPETEAEKKQRLKDFEKTRKLWDKHTQIREKERKKEEAKAAKMQVQEAPVETEAHINVTEEEKKKLVNNLETQHDNESEMKVTKVDFRSKQKESVYNVEDENY